MDRTILIGVRRDGRPAGVEETQQQSVEARLLPCELTRQDGTPVAWSHPDLGNRLQWVLDDRRERERRGVWRPGRDTPLPPVAAITADAGRVVRFEYYSGDERLELRYEAREPGAWDKALPPSVAPDLWTR